MAVSAIDEKPEASSSAAKAANRLLRGISSKPGGRYGERTSIRRRAVAVKKGAASSSEEHLEHEFAAHVGEEQQSASRKHPAERLSPAPAVAIAAEDQRAEDDPAEHREHHLVREAQRLAEELLGEQRAARERKGEEHEADVDQAEQQALQRQQRRHARSGGLGHAAMQPSLEAEQHQRLKRRDDEQRVGGERDRDVQQRERLVGKAHLVRIRKQRRQRRGDRGHRQRDSQ